MFVYELSCSGFQFSCSHLRLLMFRNNFILINFLVKKLMNRILNSLTWHKNRCLIIWSVFLAVFTPSMFVFLHVSNSREWRFFTYVYFFHLLIGSFVWQVSFWILMTFILGPLGKCEMRFPRYFWRFGNKCKKSVGNQTFCYIRIFKIIKQVRVKGIYHVHTNMWPTKCGYILSI